MGEYNQFEGDHGVRYMAPQGLDQLHLDEVIESTREIYEELLGPYPFTQLQVTTIADAASAGIGAQSNILIPETLWRVAPTDAFFRVVREVVSHELGHQYFFNLIGVSDPEEGWMSEGFAEFAAARASQITTGTDQHIQRNYWGYITGVNGISDAPLYGQEVRLSSASYEIMYQKGSAVLAALRNIIGHDTFDDAFRNYVTEFSQQITTTQEFERFMMDETGNPHIPLFFEQWVYGKGYAEFHLNVQPERADSGQIRVRLNQVPKAGAQARFRGLLPVYIHGSAETQMILLDLSASEHQIELNEGQWLDVDPHRTLFRRLHPTPAGDVNLNGVVDGMDLLDVTAALGRSVPGPDWRDQLDSNRDGSISPVDVDEIIASFGEGWR